jgi:hypothetical protein
LYINVYYTWQEEARACRVEFTWYLDSS